MNYYLILSYNFYAENNPIIAEILDKYIPEYKNKKTPIDNNISIVIIFMKQQRVGTQKLSLNYQAQSDFDIILDECGISTFLWEGDSISDLKKKIIHQEKNSKKYIIIEDKIDLLFPKLEKEYKLYKPFLNYHLKNLNMKEYNSEIFFDRPYNTFTLGNIAPRFEGKNGMKINNNPKKILRNFIESDIILEYDKKRDFLDRNYTSHLAQWINSGYISARTIWIEISKTYDIKKPAIAKFLSELAWRDFAYHQYQFHPDIEWENINKNISIQYEDDNELFDAWKNGKTGYKIIDAAMNQLNETGWMPNRMRMVTASFLTKNLLVSWQKGAAYFLDKLIDADPVINAFNWQWVAGTGNNCNPYFRIFNPELQAKQYDPDEIYQKKWNPQKKLMQIVDLNESRQKALRAVKYK